MRQLHCLRRALGTVGVFSEGDSLSNILSSSSISQRIQRYSGSGKLIVFTSEAVEFGGMNISRPG
jgi:hypothetical protein